MTEKTIMRIYFNVTDDGATEDVGSLINKVENLQFQITLNKKDIKTYKKKTDSLSEVNGHLRYINDFESYFELGFHLIQFIERKLVNLKVI